MFEGYPERYNDNEIPHKIRNRPALKRTASMNGYLRLSIDVDQHYNTSSAITDASSTDDVTTTTTTTTASPSFLSTQQQSTIPLPNHTIQSMMDPPSTRLSSIVTDASSITADESLFYHGPVPSSTLLPPGQQQHQQDELGSSTTTVVDDDKAQYDAVVAGTIGRSSRVRKHYCQRSWISNAIATT